MARKSRRTGPGSRPASRRDRSAAEDLTLWRHAEAKSCWTAGPVQKGAPPEPPKRENPLQPRRPEGRRQSAGQRPAHASGLDVHKGGDRHRRRMVWLAKAPLRRSGYVASSIVVRSHQRRRLWITTSESRPIRHERIDGCYCRMIEQPGSVAGTKASLRERTCSSGSGA